MRKIVKNVSLTITLACLIILLVLNLTAKQAIEEVIEESIKALIPESVTETGEKANEWLQEIMENETVKKFFNTEDFDNFKESSGYGKTKEVLEQEWSFVKEEWGQYFDEFLESQKKNLSPEQQKTIDIINFLSKKEAKWFLMIAIIINIVFIIINVWAPYKWIKNIAWATSLSGVGLFAICHYLKEFLFSITQNSDITLHSIETPAFYLLIAGIIVRFIYAVFEIIHKMNHKKEEEKDEVS